MVSFKNGISLHRVARVFVMCLAATEAQAVPVAIANGGFDQIGKDGTAPGWRMPRKQFRASYDVGMNGSGGLVYENRDDAGASARVVQGISLKAGRAYRVSAWFRTEDILCCKPGPGRWGVCAGLVWADAKGKKLGETWTYPAQGKGAIDWREISAVTPKIPEGVATAQLFVTCINPSYGLACIDKVNVEELEHRPVAAVCSSVYRNAAAEGDVTFFAALDLDEQVSPVARTTATFSYVGTDGRRHEAAGKVLAKDEARVTVPVRELALGTNDVACTVRDGRGVVLGQASCRFVRLAERLNRKVDFDRFGRCLVDGKLFFPVGMYDTVSLFGKSAFLDRFAESAFNCVMVYRYLTQEQMDALHAKGIRVIYKLNEKYTAEEGVKDGGRAFAEDIVKRFRGHPNLLAWYVNDERPLSQVPLINARQRLVEELDPDHPTWSVQDNPNTVRQYMGGFDVFGTDPYPVCRKPLGMMADYMRRQQRETFGSCPVWQVPQAFSWGYQEKVRDIERRPTEAEMLNQTWQAIAGGANGIVYFSLHAIFAECDKKGRSSEELWQELKRISVAVAAKADVVLSDPGPAVTACPASMIARTWLKDGKTQLLIVNTTREKASGTVVLVDGTSIACALEPMAEAWFEK